MSIAIKNSRIDLRVSEEDKAMIEQAANSSRMSLSNYIISIVLKQAELDVKKDEVIKLSDEGSKRLLDLLVNPPEATDSLKELLRWSE